MRRLAPALALLALASASACATAPDGAAPAATVAPAAADPRIATMQTQMTELLERIDVLNDRIARLEESQTAAPARVVETRTEPSSAPTPGELQPAQRPAARPTQKALAGAQIADDYRKAMALFGSSRHVDARHAFEAVYEADPSGELADNALFWIGETWFATGNFSNAMRYYARVVNDFSDQNKAPDALLKMALAQARTGDLALARKTLQQVIERYPYSTASSSAKAELERTRF